MKIGMTGTQSGMTEIQKEIWRKTIKEEKPNEFHHGDCLGADAQCHAITSEFPEIKIVIHPPINPQKRAFKRSNSILPQRDYIDRNHDIVNASDKMWAFPKEKEEQLRSGTWATIRYAEKVGKLVTIVFPDGTVNAIKPHSKDPNQPDLFRPES